MVRSGDFDVLTTTVKDLAQIQARTEQRLEQLVHDQMRMEDALQKLVQKHRGTRRQLGGINVTLGYT